MGSGCSKNNQPRTKTIKLLLIGPGDSGKSTVYKQLRNSRGAPLNESEKILHANGLRLNIVTGMLEIINCCLDNKADFTGLENELQTVTRLQSTIKDSLNKHEMEFDSELVDALLALWDSPVIEEFYQEALRIGRYQVQDNYKDLVVKLRDYPEWGGNEWVPTDDDCMLWRQPTVGIDEETIEDGKRRITLIDVGGQRNERKKWITLFNGVTGLIFVCSMSDYDQTLFEAEDVNRTVESITVFKSLAEKEVFEEVPIILFFNKFDLFIEKYFDQEIPINISGNFPSAPLVDKSDRSCQAAKDWYKQAFTEKLEGKAAQKEYFFHFVSALDRAQLNQVLSDCAHYVFQIVLHGSGLSNN